MAQKVVYLKFNPTEKNYKVSRTKSTLIYNPGEIISKDDVKHLISSNYLVIVDEAGKGDKD
jgi:hypothetical protein